MKFSILSDKETATLSHPSPSCTDVLSGTSMSYLDVKVPVDLLWRSTLLWSGLGTKHQRYWIMDVRWMQENKRDVRWRSGKKIYLRYDQEMTCDAWRQASVNCVCDPQLKARPPPLLPVICSSHLKATLTALYYRSRSVLVFRGHNWMRLLFLCISKETGLIWYFMMVDRVIETPAFWHQSIHQPSSLQQR